MGARSAAGQSPAGAVGNGARPLLRRRRAGPGRRPPLLPASDRGLPSRSRTHPGWSIGRGSAKRGVSGSLLQILFHLLGVQVSAKVVQCFLPAISQIPKSSVPNSLMYCDLLKANATDQSQIYQNLFIEPQAAPRPCAEDLRRRVGNGACEGDMKRPRPRGRGLIICICLSRRNGRWGALAAHDQRGTAGGEVCSVMPRLEKGEYFSALLQGIPLEQPRPSHLEVEGQQVHGPGEAIGKGG